VVLVAVVAVVAVMVAADFSWRTTATPFEFET